MPARSGGPAQPVQHWPGLDEKVEEVAPPVVEKVEKPRPVLDEAMTFGKIEMVEVRDDGWAESDEEMDYDDNQPLFDDMPPVTTASGSSSVSPTAPDKSKSETKPTSSPNSPSVTSEVADQGKTMAETAAQARERRMAEEAAAAAAAKERADAKLKQLESKQSEVPTTDTPNVHPAADETKAPESLGKQEELMKSIAQQARERRIADDRERDRLVKERAAEKLAALEAKARQAMTAQRAKENEALEMRQEQAGDKMAAARAQPAGDVRILERPRDQSRYHLWVDPDKKPEEKPAPQKAPQKAASNGARAAAGLNDTANKFKANDTRDWRARDPVSDKVTVAKRPNDKADNEPAPNAKGGKSNKEDKSQRREKEQKKRDAAPILAIPKPLPVGTQAQPADLPAPNDSGHKQQNPAELVMPDASWPVKKMRKFCEEHLVAVTKTDSAELILTKIDQAIASNGGQLRQKGQGKNKAKSQEPKTARGDGQDGEASSRGEKRREREKRRDQRRKDAEEKSEEKPVPKDKADKADKAESEKGRKADADKSKAPAAGVPTLESQGLQPIGEGFLVGSGVVVVAAAEVVQDDSGFTTVTTGDKNQRKEEQKKREVAREKELREERRREKEEQRKRDKQVKASSGTAAKPEAAAATSKPEAAAAEMELIGDLALDAPRAHSIQELNPQAAPKVAWGGSQPTGTVGTGAGVAPGVKPVSLLQVQVEEKFNKRLDPQFDAVLEEPQRQGLEPQRTLSSSSAIGSERRDGINDPWAAPDMVANQDFTTAFQSSIGQQGVHSADTFSNGSLPKDSFNALQGLHMLQIRPSGQPGAPQYPAAPAGGQPRFQALGLLGTTDPFSGGPFSMGGVGDVGVGGWNAAPGAAADPFAAPGAEQAHVGFAPDGAQPLSGSSDQWAARPRGNVGGVVGPRAVGSKKGATGSATQGAVAAPQQSHGGKNRRGGKNNGGNASGSAGAPSGAASGQSNGAAKGRQQKNGGGGGGGSKRGGRARGGKEAASQGADGAIATPAPRAAGGDANGGGKANNNRRSGRRGGAGKRGDKADSAGGAAVPAPAPAPAM